MPPATLLLDRTQWDLVVGSDGNIAVAAEPYSLAQDAASAIRTFLGEAYLDTTIGVPYLQQVFGKAVPAAILQSLLVDAALTVPGVASAQVALQQVTNRLVAGQVQVVSTSGTTSGPAPFVATPPQGV
jgi:hypothetical protein